MRPYRACLSFSVEFTQGAPSYCAYMFGMCVCVFGHDC